MPDYGRYDEGLYERINKDMSSLTPPKKPIGEVVADGNRSSTFVSAAAYINDNIAVGVSGGMWEGKQYKEDAKNTSIFVKLKGKF